MTMLKPWREVAIPHSDVLHGRFSQAEYAADLTQVHAGRAEPEYLDPIKFYDRTFITEGMRLLLDAVVRRLAGLGGDPVIQLQTAFGGGKTHTLLAVYHLASGRISPGRLPGVGPILDAANIVHLEPARIAVLEGTDFAANQTRRMPDGTEVRTLWGYLAHQLGGAEGYARVADSDLSGTSPGKDVLIRLLEQYQPCVILLDEMVAYMRQFEEGKSLVGGTFDSILSFMQALTEAIKLVPRAIMLASLPESEVELGSERGRQALAALEKVFGRVQALWKPVSSEESFEIVRRRLFEPIRDEQMRAAVCRHFHDEYVRQSAHLPTDVVENRYYQRMVASYPLHPELFDRLYEDWATLQGFQRTRGVLKLMSKVLHQLWKDNDQALLILPSALRLDTPDVRNDLVYYLTQGFDPVIERDIDGARAESCRIDEAEPRFGQLQAARKAARCIFFGGAPAASSLERIGTQKANRGIDARHILLGCLRPGDNVSVYVDVLERLRDRLHYLNEANGFYYLDTRPNLRREMEDRKRRFNDTDHVIPRLAEKLKSLLGSGGDVPIHIFTPADQVPDGPDLRVVVLAPEAPHTGGMDSLAIKAAQQILEKRGNTPRQNKNAVLFLAADHSALVRVKEQLCTVLAWESIVQDAERKVINLDFAQFDQAKAELSKAERVIPTLLRETYKRVLVPHQGSEKASVIDLEQGVVSTTDAQRLRDALMEKLYEEEYVLKAWAPQHLRGSLAQLFWREDKPAVSVETVWQSLTRYVYMPRLLNRAVFEATVRAGASEGLWAIARGQDGDAFSGLTLGTAPASLDASCLLVKPSAAARQLEQARVIGKVEPPLVNETTKVIEPPPPPIRVGPADVKPIVGPVIPPVATAKKTVRYVGIKNFDGVVAVAQVKPIIEEIYHVLVQANGRVKLRLEIEAECSAGFPEGTLRALRENSATLGVMPEFDQTE